MSRKLVVTDGSRQREMQLVGRIVVGRDPSCDITHDHSLLSRRHAEFVTAGELVVVRDLGSRNGVFVNGAKTAEQSLRPGDVVQIGPLRAEYVLDAAPLSIAPEDHDADRTSVRRAAAPAAAPKPATVAGAKSPAAAPAAAAPPRFADDEDDDATRLISSARPQAAPPAAPPVDQERPAAPVLDDDEETRFVSAPRGRAALSDESTNEDSPADAAAPAFLPLDAAQGRPEPGHSAADARVDEATYVKAAQPAAAGVATARPASQRSFVFGQLLLLGVLVLAASALSLRVEGMEAPLSAFVVPVFVVLAAGYLVSGVIDRRFGRTVVQPFRAGDHTAGGDPN